MNFSVKVHSEGETSLDLVSAVLLYKSQRGDVYATSHPIILDADQPHRKMIGAGVPLSKGALAGFADAVSAATAFSGFLPEKLLFSSANIIAWWTPAAIRTTWFKNGATTAHAPTAHPALVFVATPTDWFVFALRDDARPTPSTVLCHSPHFNVWNGGRICTGNVTLPPNVGTEAIGIYEDAFFRSHFTHPNRADAVKYKGGMQQLWHDQFLAPDPERMQRALLNSKETLQAAIERISKTSKPN